MLLMLVLGCLAAVSATHPTTDKPTNLKVLPKDIDEHVLDDIMVKECGEGLGVKCNYCHVQDKTTEKFDYASDAIPEKDTARAMMRMTIELNKKYFFKDKPMIGSKELVVTCYTCHRGNAVPR